MTSKQRHRTWYRLEKRRKRLRQWTTVGLAILLPAAALFGYEGYKFSLKWKEASAMHQGKVFLGKRDFSNALSHFRDAAQINPNNVEACRYLAETYDQIDSREALIWQQRISQLEPGNTANLIACAQTSLRLGDWATAEHALRQVDQKARRSSKFHAVAAELALAANRPLAEAELHYATAVELDPTNATYRLNLAKLQLRSANVETNHAAHLLLAKLRTKPEFELPAMRALVQGLRQEDADTNLLSMAEELASKEQSTLSDRLLLLEFLQRRHPARFSSYLAQLQEQSNAIPKAVAELISWMNNHGLSLEAIEWLKRLSPAVQNQESVPLVVAESLVLVKDWDGLYDWVSKAQWQQNEFIRLAFQARAEREKNDPVEASDKWRLARHAAQGNFQRLIYLADLATRWQWDREAEELWWMVAKGDLNQRQALTKLQELYRAQKDTEGLQRVAKALYHLAPLDPVVMNNFALLSLLVSKDTSLAKELAKDLYVRETNNPAFLVTYAYSLHQQGESDRALRLASSLSEEQLREANLSLYYGLFLAAAGQQEMARKYFSIAEKNTELLPEERSLIFQAAKSVNPLAHEGPIKQEKQ